MKLLRSMTFVQYLVAPLAALVLAGCNGQELYSKLNERQANEMVAALREAGIEAEKRAAEGSFSVQIPAKDFGAAVNTLKAQGLPRDEFQSLGQVFKQGGMVSTPTEERARMLYALSQELSNTIANIDGVITARVHLAMPEKNPLADKVLPSGASIFIKHRANCDLTAQVPQIKALVVNSIEGLPYDNVTVALFAAEGTARELVRPAAPARVKQVSGQAVSSSGAAIAGGARMTVTLASGAAVGLLAFGSGGFLWLRRRRDDVAEPPAAPTKSLPGRNFDAALKRAAACNGSDQPAAQREA